MERRIRVRDGDGYDGKWRGEMVHVCGSDDTGWSWRCVDADGHIVAEGTCAFADEALSIAHGHVSAPPTSCDRMGLFGA